MVSFDVRVGGVLDGAVLVLRQDLLENIVIVGEELAVSVKNMIFRRQQTIVLLQLLLLRLLSLGELVEESPGPRF